MPGPYVILLRLGPRDRRRIDRQGGPAGTKKPCCTQHGLMRRKTPVFHELSLSSRRGPCGALAVQAASCRQIALAVGVPPSVMSTALLWTHDGPVNQNRSAP